MNIQEARDAQKVNYHALVAACGTPTESDALNAYNKGAADAMALGAAEYAGTTSIVNGKPWKASTITPERAAEVMANAARANARR